MKISIIHRFREFVEMIRIKFGIIWRYRLQDHIIIMFKVEKQVLEFRSMHYEVEMVQLNVF